jgi:hypothetical protein
MSGLPHNFHHRLWVFELTAPSRLTEQESRVCWNSLGLAPVTQAAVTVRYPTFDNFAASREDQRRFKICGERICCSTRFVDSHIFSRGRSTAGTDDYVPHGVVKPP